MHAECQTTLAANWWDQASLCLDFKW